MGTSRRERADRARRAVDAGDEEWLARHRDEADNVQSLAASASTTAATAIRRYEASRAATERMLEETRREGLEAQGQERRRRTMQVFDRTVSVGQLVLAAVAVGVAVVCGILAILVPVVLR